MAEQWRLLVVEGEENLNWNIVNTLQKDGYIVLGVTGGAEAIRILWNEEYDVVICSQRMPDADGFDLLQWMRTYCPSARMIMLGEPGSGIDRAQALETGVASYLEKPLDLQELKEELRRLLHQTGFSASLDSFDLLDVIQIITMSRKNIALVVNTGLEEQGTLHFQGGELIWAEYGMLRGEEAFFALAAHKNGTVVHRPWSEQITPNVTQPLSRLIFQALQYRSKYAEYQQMSSELEAIRPGGTVPEPSTLPPLPSTTFPETLQDFDEEDDRPFQFVAEDFSTGGSPASVPFDPLMPDGATNARVEQVGGGSGVAKKNVGSGAAKQPEGEQKAWWEPTGAYPSIQASGSIHAVTEGKAGNGMNVTPTPIQQTATGQSSNLPSWLTDQPTHLDLPVLRGNTGQMPVTPQERSPAPPQTPPAVEPASPAQIQNGSAEWSALPKAASFASSTSGLRKINPAEAMFTNPHRAVKSNGSQPGASLRPSPAEWQTPTPPTPEPSGQMGAIKLPGLPEHMGNTLQSLSTLKKNSAPLTVEARPATNGATPLTPTQGGGERNQTGTETTPPGKRNYPALAAALQTLGYSVAGFIASAVVSVDGTAIAQVAVDETDISSLCAHFSKVVQSTLQAVEQERGEGCEHIVITSRTQQILLRILGKKKDIFQVLITTRETNPVESLDVMANIEAALEAAL